MKEPWKNHKYAVLATDVVIFTMIDGYLQLLLIKTTDGPYSGQWALPGGLVQTGESLDEAAARHLTAKTGLDSVYLEQLYTFGSVGRDPWGRVVSVAYFALLPDGDRLSLSTTERYSAIEWTPVGKLPSLAYDHSEIVRTALERLKSKIEYTNIVMNLLPPEFSLGDLQGIYEIILGRRLDKRNFRKRILALRIVRKTGRKSKGESKRPSDLYEFCDTEIRALEMI